MMPEWCQTIKMLYTSYINTIQILYSKNNWQQIVKNIYTLLILDFQTCTFKKKWPKEISW